MQGMVFLPTHPHAPNPGSPAGTTRWHLSHNSYTCLPSWDAHQGLMGLRILCVRVCCSLPLPVPSSPVSSSLPPSTPSIFINPFPFPCTSHPHSFLEEPLLLICRSSRVRAYVCKGRTCARAKSGYASTQQACARVLSRCICTYLLPCRPCPWVESRSWGDPHWGAARPPAGAEHALHSGMLPCICIVDARAHTHTHTHIHTLG